MVSEGLFADGKARTRHFRQLIHPILHYQNAPEGNSGAFSFARWSSRGSSRQRKKAALHRAKAFLILSIK